MTPLVLTVDRESDVPLGTQLDWRLRTLILTGGVGAGTRLPGVRELAEQAGVHVNTIRGVYSRLEEEGLVASLRAELARVLADATAEAIAAGLDPREVAAALFVGGGIDPAGPGDGARRAGPGRDASRAGRAVADGGKERGGPPEGGASAPAREGERARRRRLRDEIADLERELVYLEPLGPGGDQPGIPAGRILTATELEEVRDAVAARVDDLRAARAEARRRALQPPEPVPAPAPSSRVWRNAGVWTGTRPRIVSFGA
jgi:DNA-binding transcriptional regulator YhcF (GntR family)